MVHALASVIIAVSADANAMGLASAQCDLGVENLDDDGAESRIAHNLERYAGGKTESGQTSHTARSAVQSDYCCCVSCFQMSKRFSHMHMVHISFPIT